MNILATMENWNKKYSLVGDKPVFDNETFAWIGDVEKNYPAIREELTAVLKNRDSIPSFQQVLNQEQMTGGDDWKSYFFYVAGHKVKGNCEKCPMTYKSLQMIPGMRTAFFSILKPGTHLPAHRGPFNGVLRYHLGLIIPASHEKCRIRIHNSVRTWQPGKSLVFDDSYDHEVWNSTPEERVVLFVDFLRPLPVGLRLLNKACLTLASHLLDEIKSAKKFLGQGRN